LTERKFPVAGEYLTKFEDEIDGKKIESTTPAVKDFNIINLSRNYIPQLLDISDVELG
jgi:hypothetical protein